MRVKSKTENLSVIRDFVSANALNAGIPMTKVEDIMLAVDEACTNIIKHAYKLSPEGEIKISIDYDKEKFTITIIDYGKSFQPETVPLPDLQKSLMDDVKYTSVPGKYNQVLLSKNIGES